MTGEFRTLAGDGEAEVRIKGSTFIGLAFPIASEEEFRGRLLERSRRFFDATHNCAAWRLREGSWRTIDNGEPGGSAGVPILAAIDGEQLTDCGVIVTRYFGGTKLGVGGLVRAYGESAQAALAVAPRRTGHPGVRVVIRYPYASTSVVMRCIDRFNLAEVDHGYGADGRAEVSFLIPLRDQSALSQVLRDESSGMLSADPLSSSVIYR